MTFAHYTLRRLRRNRRENGFEKDFERLLTTSQLDAKIPVSANLTIKSMTGKKVCFPS